MMTAAMPAREPGVLEAMGAGLRAALAAAAGLFVVLAVALAALAAALVGVLIALAAMTLRLLPRRRVEASETLEGRRTPTGWVVEIRHS